MFKNLLPVLLAMAALPAGATTTFYVGSTMGATTFGADLITQGLTLTGPFTYAGVTTSTTITDGPSGITFSGHPGTLDASGGTINFVGNSSSEYLQIDVPSGIYALGLYIDSTATSNRTWSYGVLGGGTTNFTLTPGTMFLGIMGTTPLEALPSIVLKGPASTTGINVTGFSLGTPTGGGGGGGGGGEVPEPSTFALIGSGLIALPLLARRKRRT